MIMIVARALSVILRRSLGSALVAFHSVKDEFLKEEVRMERGREDWRVASIVSNKYSSRQQTRGG